MVTQTVAKDVIETRKELRKELLIELYEVYFSNSNHTQTLDLDDIRNTEKLFAYEYLKAKGQITINQGRHNLVMSITASGIDTVENY